MTDNKQFNQVNEATRDLVKSFSETNQTFVNSFVTLQERNLRWAQNLWLNWMELLPLQAESVSSLTQQWGQQTQKQLKVSQQLASASLGLSLTLLSAPLSISWQKMDTATTATQREPEHAQPPIQTPPEVY
jgi:hypothetical protein